MNNSGQGAGAQYGGVSPQFVGNQNMTGQEMYIPQGGYPGNVDPTTGQFYGVQQQVPNAQWGNPQAYGAQAMQQMNAGGNLMQGIANQAAENVNVDMNTPQMTAMPQMAPNSVPMIEQTPQGWAQVPQQPMNNAQIPVAAENVPQQAMTAQATPQPEAYGALKKGAEITNNFSASSVADVEKLQSQLASGAIRPDELYDLVTEINNYNVSQINGELGES